MADIESKWTISVPEAGRRYYGLGKNAAYEAARRGDIPAIRIGRKLRAIVSQIERRLGDSIARQLPRDDG